MKLIIEAKGHEGVEKYLELVKKQGYKDIEEWVQHCSEVVASELYLMLKKQTQKKFKKSHTNLTTVVLFRIKMEKLRISKLVLT